MADELRLKVTQSEYQTRLGTLDSKIEALKAIYEEYATLKMDAQLVLGDGDSNLEQLRATVDKNMQAVEGQRQMLVESRRALEKQNEELGILAGNIEELLRQTAETAKTGFQTIKIIGDLVN